MPCEAPDKVKKKDCPGPSSEPADKRCDICGVRAQLTARRGSIIDALKSVPNVKGSDLQKAWQGRVDNIVVGVFQHVFDETSPCAFALAIAGSGAREEACMYSDLDC